MYFPVTTLYASLLGIMLIVLSARVSRARRRAKKSLGQGDDAVLQRTVRSQGNFIEYVPLALILLLLAETEIGQLWLLHVLGSLLLLGRILHAYGIMLAVAPNFARFWGTALTWLVIVCCSLLNLWHLN